MVREKKVDQTNFSKQNSLPKKHKKNTPQPFFCHQTIYRKKTDFLVNNLSLSRINLAKKIVKTKQKNNKKWKPTQKYC